MVFEFVHHDFLLLVINQFIILPMIQLILEVTEFLLKRLILLILEVPLKFAFIRFIAVTVGLKAVIAEPLIVFAVTKQASQFIIYFVIYLMIF
jgi:hypothetical protein